MISTQERAARRATYEWMREMFLRHLIDGKPPSDKECDKIWHKKRREAGIRKKNQKKD